MARKAGQIITRGESTWLVRVYRGRDSQTGTRKYLNQTIHGPFREAQRFLNLKLQQRDNGRVSRAAVLSLNQLLDQWLTTVVKARVRPRTFKDYETLLRLHIRPVLGSRLIGTISQIDLQTLYARMYERGLSARTVEYTNAVLESAFRQAIRWKMLAEDPCVGVDLPRVKRKEMEALSVEECRRFLNIAEKSEWFPVLALALTTGMRPSEYLALRWTDIDWKRGTASVCRTIQVTGSEWTFDDTKRRRSRRIVKLQNFVLKAIQGLKQAQESRIEVSISMYSGLIFVSASGLPLKQRVVKREFRKLLATAGIRPVRLYDLRHTAATLGIAAGVSVKVISDQLGQPSVAAEAMRVPAFGLMECLLFRSEGHFGLTMSSPVIRAFRLT
jgi:integrase